MIVFYVRIYKLEAAFQILCTCNVCGIEEYTIWIKYLSVHSCLKKKYLLKFDSVDKVTLFSFLGKRRERKVQVRKRKESLIKFVYAFLKQTLGKKKRNLLVMVTWLCAKCPSVIVTERSGEK